ncbi:MAG: hypothetical protein QOE93_729 [Actinomycetota bacterium]|nr:hypothetical protein [Actinomycetota bacterium]
MPLDRTRLGSKGSGRRRLGAVLLGLATMSTVLAANARAKTTSDPPLQARAAADKAVVAGQVDPSTRGIILKFREGTRVWLRGGVFVSTGSADVAAVNAAVKANPGTVIERLFKRSEADLAQEKTRIEARSRRQQADFNLYYRLVAPPGADVAALIAALNQQSVVEAAYSEPQAAPPPVTPDFTGQQGYRASAPGGIDANFASTLPGGKGQNVVIADIEYSWNINHEDLTKAALPGTPIANGTAADPFSDFNHGTAVLGELVGDENSFGVTGILSGATLRLVNASTTGGYQLANAINAATGALTPGDVILIEQQTTGPNGGCDATSQVGCAPVEWVGAFYDAIVAATSAGIIVIEPAGNGSQDLDSDPYGTINFPSNKPDSGAIVVGAGAAPGCTNPARGRLGFSNFGARVDVQGWGQCVVTTGYGDLQGGADPNVHYTNTFGGTSSASPIVAGAAGVLSSIAQQTGGLLTPAQMRTRLQTNASPQQFGLAGNIGPLPNLFLTLGGSGCSSPPPATITASPGVITFGTAGNDVIYGTAGPDRITGLGGNDVIVGMGGNDQLVGDDGNDTLCGGLGNDSLSGGAGTDQLEGDAGNDDLTGGADDDKLFGGDNVDRLAGGTGTDTCVAGGQAGDASAGPPSCEVIA